MNSRREFLAQAMRVSVGAATGGALLPLLAAEEAKAAKPGKWAGKSLSQTDLAEKSAPETQGQNSRITLPPPDQERGKPLMRTLALRRSNRQFREDDLPLQNVSDMLWAAFGINRPDGKRTIPTAMNKQNLVVYAAMSSGIWRYMPQKHELELAAWYNLTSLLGDAPLTLGYAAEGRYGPMHAGSAYQNVGLYCASVGLGNVVKATGIEVMAQYIAPPTGYSLLIIQSVGWPK
jgi:hypothetical protein